MINQQEKANSIVEIKRLIKAYGTDSVKHATCMSSKELEKAVNGESVISKYALKQARQRLGE